MWQQLVMSLWSSLSRLLLAGKTATVGFAGTAGLVATGGPIGLAATVVSVALAGATLGYGVYYAKTGQPFLFALSSATGSLLPDAPIVGKALKSVPPHYLFAIGGVTSPLGVAVSPKGDRVYVSESLGERMIRVFDPAGKSLGSLAPPNTDDGRLPTYMAVDPSGKLYVTDRLRHTIDIYGPDGSYQGPYQPGGAVGLIPNPLGISVDNKGGLYLTDVSLGIHRVMVLGADGRLKTAFGSEGSGPMQFSYPNALVTDDKTGNLFVSDGNNARVIMFDPEGKALSVFTQGDGEPLSLPRGMAVDSLGRLYVVDTVAGQVNVYDVRQTPPVLLYAFGQPGIRDGQLNYPNAIAVDNNTGRVYVADRINNRVSVWAY